MKSQQYMQGFTDALVFVSDIFEKHSDAFLKKHLFQRRQTKLIVSIIDACIRRRETLMDVGPDKMNLFVRSDWTASLKEK